MLTFLPQSHPQAYLPMLFRLWESVNSYIFDERMLQFLAQLSEMHLDPTISDPKAIDEIPDDARSENEGRPNWAKDDLNSAGPWSGIYKDVGIFTDYDWHFIMCKCLASMGWCLPKYHPTKFSPKAPTFRNPTCGLGISYHGSVCR
jgi:proteasome activator subunit 4